MRIEDIEPITNREIGVLTVGVYLGIILNHLELWMVW